MPEVIETTNELDKVALESGMADLALRPLRDAFYPFFEQAMTIRAVADNINVTDATQVTDIRHACAKRKELATVRVAADKVRKALKEESLRKGELIQNFYNVIKNITEPAEERLYEMEKFAERAEAARKESLRASRTTLLAPFGIDLTGYLLADMSEDTFKQLLANTTAAHEAKVQAAAKAEADRVAAQAAKDAEDKRIRAENERVRIELETAQAQAKAERDAAEKARRDAEAKAAAERKAVEDAARAEREALQAKADAEAKAAADKARKEREAAEAVARKEREARQALEAKVAAENKIAEAKSAAEAKAKKDAAKAPDKTKIAALAVTVRAIAIPACATPEGITAATTIAGFIEKLAARIEAMANEV